MQFCTVVMFGRQDRTELYLAPHQMKKIFHDKLVTL